uniref:Uncharacterized protein n=1 Tax=Ipomoea trifida TaxID=35884 RepID=A0PAD2_IPOTF|nr:hypothetical protein [Ipomoea trifida]
MEAPRALLKQCTVCGCMNLLIYLPKKTAVSPEFHILVLCSTLDIGQHNTKKQKIIKIHLTFISLNTKYEGPDPLLWGL